MKLLLIDGHYYVYRSFFAIRELINSRGEPTNAIHGFVKTVRRMLKDLQPDRAAVLWDMGMPARRMELQPQYKQQRTEMPDTMRPQLTALQELCPLLGIASIGVADTEADDLMAAYACAARRSDGTQEPMDVILATNDKDLFQLVDDHVQVYTTSKTELTTPGATFALLGSDSVRAKWGVEPPQILSILALTGDAVDNIPGVPGFGVKTAAGLVRQFGDIESLLSNTQQIKNERQRLAIETHREQILQNLEMVRLECDLPLPLPLEALGITPDYAPLLTSLRRWELKSTAAEVEAEASRQDGSTAPTTPSAPPTPPKPGFAQDDLFA